MSPESRDEFIINQYRKDEETMIRLFARWCLNHDLDAVVLYARAYPGQPQNPALETAIGEAQEEDLDIPHETLIDILQMFGNDDLAFIVAEEAARLPGQ